MKFDQAHLHEIESRCTQESPPRCQGLCPFQLDVRAFLAAMAESRHAQARKILDRALPLPGILTRICDHPCENACLRQGLGGSLAISKLEQHCAAVAEPSRMLPLPPKKFSLAVLGSGLAGLVAAAELARKGYPVTIFYRDEITAPLVTRFPSLKADDGLAADLEDLSRLRVTFEESCPDAALLARCEAEFAGVLLDADAARSLAPQEDAIDGVTRHWRGNVCCAGGLGRTPTGHAFPEAARQAGEGRRAAQTLERLAGKVSLMAAREKQQGSLHVSLEGIVPVPRVEPAGGSYTPEEARAEAARCLQCQCLICVRECVYLQKYKGYPRTYARQIYNNASIVQGFHTANALINGCSLCGRCEQLCPEHFSMADLCRAAREDMVARSYMPAAAHEFALEDMESASGPECALALNDVSLSEGAAPAWLFFPGCQLAASRGEQVIALHAHLREHLPGGVALYLSCCGIPAHWAGRQAMFAEHSSVLLKQWEKFGRPGIVAACSSCMKALRLALSEARVRSAWEILNALPLPRRCGTDFSEPLSVHDPCTARHDAAWRNAVRDLARKCGARLEEPRLSGEKTSCCGYGGLVSCARPDLAAEMSADRAAALPHTALASCIMCRDRLAAQGKDCLHLLDLLFPRPAMSGKDAAREKGPGLSARRAGRAALRRLLRDRAGEETPALQPPGMRVPPETLARLEDRHILLDDVTQAVAWTERSGQYFENLENGHRLGSFRPRHVTFWVEYSREGEGLVLHDAWCHRMKVPGSGGAAVRKEESA
ncbi:MAG: 4Fe-4S dicluster domain-containing protein [Desulfovibrio sp.]|jgi:Fe-S oxidoreductase|nr:4Fe-4S dicluster domain-containing protein [Desulfovibrio sp.]